MTINKFLINVVNQAYLNRGFNVENRKSGDKSVKPSGTDSTKNLPVIPERLRDPRDIRPVMYSNNVNNNNYGRNYPNNTYNAINNRHNTRRQNNQLNQHQYNQYNKYD